MSTALTDTAARDPRWAMLAARETEPGFIYAVTTTGVYCRAGCAARLPRPENVRFFVDAAAARAAGFRACLRCKPDQPRETAHAARIADACRLIENAEESPTLARIAAAAGLSPFHFHRVFKQVTGMTPKAYAVAQRGQRVRAALDEADTVTRAIYDAGFNASGRFYATAAQTLGMTPTAFRAGGAGEDICFATGVCSLGAVLVAQSAAGICAISLADDPEALVAALRRRFFAAVLRQDEPGLGRRLAEVIAFVEAPKRGLDLPLDIRGTAFQHSVWQALLAIGPGETARYAEIAARIGKPAAVRAVAGACAANTLAVAIPCHRVVRGDGAASGYRWGVARKRQLLKREACDAG